MTVPTSPYLRLKGVLVDRISNFGSFPPTAKLRDRWGIRLILLNHADPLVDRAQMLAIEQQGVFAGSWEPVPDSGSDGVELAARISVRVGVLQPRVIGLNLEALTMQKIRDFLWGRPGHKGFRGANGVVGSTDGLRPGLAAYWIDEPFKDGSVKPHVDLKLARMMLAVEGFDGPMNQIDHPRAIQDRVEGFRDGSGIRIPAEAYPSEQLVGCYDAALGIRIRSGLYFDAERLPGIFTLRRRVLNRMTGRMKGRR